MKNVDYLIVGLGVAGICLAHQFLKKKECFVVINQSKENSATKVAAGVYNPIVLKRFTKIWDAENQMKQTIETFSDLEVLLGNQYVHPIPIHRILANEKELRTWKKKSKLKDLNHFMSSEIQENYSEEIDAKFGLGLVSHTGRIDLESLSFDFQNFLQKNHLYREEKLNYNELKVYIDYIEYKNIRAKKIIFCEGFGVIQNPFFKWLPIPGNKGNALQIELPKPLPNFIYKSKVMLVPEAKEKQYYLGATYQRDFIDEKPSSESKDELMNGLKTFYKNQVKIIKHTTAIRPTVIDRRPIIGEHPIHKNILIMNGMGTRGTLLAPIMAKELADHLTNHFKLNDEVNISRFYSYFQTQS